MSSFSNYKPMKYPYRNGTFFCNTALAQNRWHVKVAAAEKELAEADNDAKREEVSKRLEEARATLEMYLAMPDEEPDNPDYVEEDWRDAKRQKVAVQAPHEQKSEKAAGNMEIEAPVEHKPVGQKPVGHKPKASSSSNPFGKVTYPYRGMYLLPPTLIRQLHWRDEIAAAEKELAKADNDAKREEVSKRVEHARAMAEKLRDLPYEEPDGEYTIRT